MRPLTKSLLNGALSFAISVTMVLTVADESDAVWERTDLALVAGISAFLSAVCASHFGTHLRR